jgi:hypothetical protein
MHSILAQFMVAHQISIEHFVKAHKCYNSAPVQQWRKGFLSNNQHRTVNTDMGVLLGANPDDDVNH